MSLAASAFMGLLSPLEAARRLHRSTERVRQLVRAGRLGAVATPLGRLIDERGVERLLAERTTREPVEHDDHDEQRPVA